MDISQEFGEGRTLAAPKLPPSGLLGNDGQKRVEREEAELQQRQCTEQRPILRHCVTLYLLFIDFMLRWLISISSLDVLEKFQY